MARTLRISQLFIIFLIFQQSLSAQKLPANADKLAIQYYEEKEFEKANIYLEDLFATDPSAWYIYYYKSLVAVKDYDKAEKITKRLLKQNKENVFLYVFLGQIYKLHGEEKKERESYQKAIKELNPVQPQLDNLAGAFRDAKLYDYAIETYNKARKVSPAYPYFYERAEIYKLKNDLQSMINEYLDALEFRETEIQTVQAQLQNSLGYDDVEGGIKNPLLKQELQRRIQKNPQKEVLVEFLIFILKQQKDFEGAFVQSRALDKRLQEDGQRVYELAKICISNAEFHIAKKCLNYVIDKGPENLLYESAIIDELSVEFQLLTTEPQPKREDLLELEKKLLIATEKYKQSSLNHQLVKNLATIMAFYLDKSPDAILLLEDYISKAGIDPYIAAEHKLLLGDIYLVKADIWEASLLYSQVEKIFKYETIGFEAKYRNAKLSFYAGDFSWAKAQADVLKGSTSKLIANDALELSLVINDAIGVDTNEVPLQMFASAELLAVQHKFQEAIVRMDSINLLFSNNTLGDDIFFRKAKIFYSLGQLVLASEMYQNIITYYPTELYGDDAQFRLALLYEEKLNDTEKAKVAYESLLNNYPGSIYTVEARKRFRVLRGDVLNN